MRYWQIPLLLQLCVVWINAQITQPDFSNGSQQGFSQGNGGNGNFSNYTGSSMLPVQPTTMEPGEFYTQSPLSDNSPAAMDYYFDMATYVKIYDVFRALEITNGTSDEQVELLGIPDPYLVFEIHFVANFEYSKNITLVIRMQKSWMNLTFNMSLLQENRLADNKYSMHLTTNMPQNNIGSEKGIGNMAGYWPKEKWGNFFIPLSIHYLAIIFSIDTSGRLCLHTKKAICMKPKKRFRSRPEFKIYTIATGNDTRRIAAHITRASYSYLVPDAHDDVAANSDSSKNEKAESAELVIMYVYITIAFIFIFAGLTFGVVFFLVERVRRSERREDKSIKAE